VSGDSAALQWLALAVDFSVQGARWYGPEADSPGQAVRLYALALLHDWRARLAELPEAD
jgi:hypothetical protein